jgi:hypothetical protein
LKNLYPQIAETIRLLRERREALSGEVHLVDSAILALDKLRLVEHYRLENARKAADTQVVYMPARDEPVRIKATQVVSVAPAKLKPRPPKPVKVPGRTSNMTHTNLTEPQYKVYVVLRERINAGDTKPALSRLAADAGVPFGSVLYHVKALINWGFIASEGKFGTRKYSVCLNIVPECMDPIAAEWVERAIMGAGKSHPVVVEPEAQEVREVQDEEQGAPVEVVAGRRGFQ